MGLRFLCACVIYKYCKWIENESHADLLILSGSEWVDPEDPTVIAETELLGAAASIEAAAKKLEQLKPRAKPKVSFHPSIHQFSKFKHTHTAVISPPTQLCQLSSTKDCRKVSFLFCIRGWCYFCNCRTSRLQDVVFLYFCGIWEVCAHLCSFFFVLYINNLIFWSLVSNEF